MARSNRAPPAPAPSCSAASATALSRRAPRPIALAKAIGPRRSGAGTGFLAGDDPGLATGRLDPLAEVDVRQHGFLVAARQLRDRQPVAAHAQRHRREHRVGDAEAAEQPGPELAVIAAAA